MKPLITKKQLWQHIWNAICIIFGLFLFALGWTAFLLPNELAGGGIAGLSAILYFATGFPVGISSLVFNIILIAIAFKILGKKFVVITICCSLILSFFFEALPTLFEFLKQYVHLPQPFLAHDLFLSSVLGGLTVAIGAGIVINYGGNTGGTDIIVLMIGKYRNIAYGRTSLQINVLIVALSFFVLRDIEKLVYSYVAFIVNNLISDMVIGGYRQSFQVMVFSKKSDRIAERISTEIRRGVTMMRAYGWYTKDEQDVLIVILHRTEKYNTMQIIKQEDPNAFISVSKVQGVFGKNFDELKVPVKEKLNKEKSESLE